MKLFQTKSGSKTETFQIASPHVLPAMNIIDKLSGMSDISFALFTVKLSKKKCIYAISEKMNWTS